MLTMFQVRRTFNKLNVSIWVDCTIKEAECTITYDRCIIRSEKVDFWRVDTPEHAEAWLAQPYGEKGSLLETWEWLASRNLLSDNVCTA